MPIPLPKVIFSGSDKPLGALAAAVSAGIDVDVDVELGEEDDQVIGFLCEFELTYSKLRCSIPSNVPNAKPRWYIIMVIRDCHWP